MTIKYCNHQIAKWFTNGCRQTTTNEAHSICNPDALSVGRTAPSKLRTVLIGWTLLDSTQSLPRLKLLMCNLVREA